MAVPVIDIAAFLFLPDFIARTGSNCLARPRQSESAVTVGRGGNVVSDYKTEKGQLQVSLRRT
jgi:hypothetical protein